MISIFPSRTFGVAPLAVFFDATGTTGASKPFHDLEYRWDFGDAAGSPVSGTAWGTGSRPGASCTPDESVSCRNSATGPVAAHVFETPGTYTVTLTVTDGTNTDTTTVTITVDHPDAVFLAGDTICFSNLASPSWSGCPADALRVPLSNNFAAVAALAATGKRLLLQRGGTWTTASTAFLTATGPGIVGAFGSGERPIIRATGNTTILELSSGGTPTFKDWRIMDLELDGQSGSATEGVLFEGGADQITLLRLNIHHVHQGIIGSTYVLDIYNGGGTSPHHVWDQLAIVDSNISTIIGGSGGYGVYMSATRFSLLGTLIDDTTAAEHGFRSPGLAKAVLSNSTFKRAAVGKHVFTLRAPCRGGSGCDILPVEGTNSFTEYVVISDNKFEGGNFDWTVTTGPQNSTADERVRHSIWERNWFTAGTGTQVALRIAATSEITVRNNICNATGALANVCFTISDPGMAPPPDQVRVYNNTYFSSSSGPEFVGLGIDSAATNVTHKNNLGYAPNHTSPVMRSGSGSGLSESNNSIDSQLANTSPGFVSGLPSSPADFRLTAGSGSYAINSGASVPVFSDFFRLSRPQGGGIDIGAMEGP